MEVSLAHMLISPPDKSVQEEGSWFPLLTAKEGRYVWKHWDAIKHHARADILGVAFALGCPYIQDIHTRYHQGVNLPAVD